MSADGINGYVKQVMPPTMPLPQLLAGINQQLGSSKSRGGKRILSELRELCLYAVPGQLYPSTEYAMGLLRTIEDSGDPDIDKKVLRLSYFLLFEYIHSQHVQDSTFNAVLTSLASYFQISVSRIPGATLCLTWRHLGRTAILVLANKGKSDNSYTDIITTMHRTMKSLKYPEKKKGFLGREKGSEAYEMGLQTWAAVFSALRRAQSAPTAECMPIVFEGCMSSHQALSRHGFALVRIAVESDPALFSPFLLDKLKSGQFFSHASIDERNCSQLVHACRVMMTAPAATMEMIEQALTVIFNLLKNPRLAIVLESVRALTEAPQAWAFKEVLSKLGGPSIPSRIASALIGPINSLTVAGCNMSVSEDTTTEGDNIDSSAHMSPIKTSAHGTPPVKGKNTAQSPAGADGVTVSTCIGAGDISWGPLCRACVRLGLYMVHRPTDDIEGMSAEDDPQINALLDALQRVMQAVDTVDARIVAQSPIDPIKNIPLACLSVLPHVKCELLKAYTWLLPENRSGSSKCVTMWTQLEWTLARSLPSLSEHLIEGLISNMVARLKATKAYSADLVSLIISITSAAIATTLATSTVLACLMTQIWTVVGEMAAKWTHASAQLFVSVLGCIDGTVLQSTHGILVAPHAFIAHDMTPAQVLRGLKQHSYWMIGEYIYLWMDIHALRNAYCFENVAYFGERTAIIEIMPRLVNAMWTERGSVQLSALEALYKIAAFAVKLSVENSSEDAAGIVSYIRHEMNSFLGSVIGIDDAYSSNDWVLAVSECQRLASLGLPNDTGRRPSMLHVVNRGQYSDDCADIARSTSCYLLALDTMWNALNKKDESEYTVLHRLATAVDASFKKNDDDKDTDKGTYSLSVNDTDQMEFLKLQLAVNIS